MRILWYNWRDIKNPAAGGAEVVTHEICKRLASAAYGGHDITLFTSNFEGGKDEERLDGIRIVRKGGRYSVYGEARKYYSKFKDQFDLVVDEINTKPFHTPDFVKDKPIIAMIHQLAREFWFYETRFPINVLGYLFLERYWLQKYRNIPTIAISNSTKQDLLSMGFANVQVIPQGLTTTTQDNRIAHKQREPTLIFVGRLKKAKRPDDAIRAFFGIKDELPNAKLWIVGNGYMIQELKAIARERYSNTKYDSGSFDDTYEEIGDVTFFGNTSNERKLDLMSRAHVLLVPGVREGWGLVVTEANSMGTPAVAYDVPGLRDSVIDSHTGVLVQKNDYVGLGIEAVQLLKDHVLLTQLSDNAREHSKQFNWEDTTARFAAVLRSYSQNAENEIPDDHEVKVKDNEFIAKNGNNMF